MHQALPRKEIEDDDDGRLKRDRVIEVTGALKAPRHRAVFRLDRGGAVAADSE